jgi:hypothetical protein
MVHIPSDHSRAELLTNNQLVRFCLAEGADGLEPTLIVKSSSLMLKYLVRRKSFRILVSKLVPGGQLFYAVEVPDDPTNPASIWSIVENVNELQALQRTAQGEKCHVALFNEAVVNVCWARMHFAMPSDGALMFSDVTLCPENVWKQYECAVDAILDNRHNNLKGGTIAELHPVVECAWVEIISHYVTNRLAGSILSIISENEGDQQEELAVWLVDQLSASGAVKKPQVEEEAKSRELSDVLLNYSGGAFIFESKTLSIFDRDTLPDRRKLAKNTEKNVEKAISQMKGGCRNIRNGNRVFDISGKTITVTRDMPIHCIVLVPDLSLLSESSAIHPGRLKQFAHDTSGCMLHLLDPSELLGTVRNALLLSEKSQRTTPMMAFDVMLIRRFESALTAPTLDLRFRIELQEEGAKEH